MPTLSVKFDTPEKASLYKEVLKQIIYENPKIRNQSQAMDHIFESFFDIHLRTKSYKNLIHRNGIHKISSLKENNYRLILKHEKAIQKKNDKLLILKTQMKNIQKNNSELLIKNKKTKAILNGKLREILDIVSL